MHARVTQFEIDTLRISLPDAVATFKERVLPRLRAHPECSGVMALTTPEGKGMLLSFWESNEAAEAAISSGFYDEQVAEFTLFLRQPPGREHYEVALEAQNAGRPVVIDMDSKLAKALANFARDLAGVEKERAEKPSGVLGRLAWRRA